MSVASILHALPDHTACISKVLATSTYTLWLAPRNQRHLLPAVPFLRRPCQLSGEQVVIHLRHRNRGQSTYQCVTRSGCPEQLAPGDPPHPAYPAGHAHTVHRAHRRGASSTIGSTAPHSTQSILHARCPVVCSGHIVWSCIPTFMP